MGKYRDERVNLSAGREEIQNCCCGYTFNRTFNTESATYKAPAAGDTARPTDGDIYDLKVWNIDWKRSVCFNCKILSTKTEIEHFT